jgi:hypothetical protein
VVVVVRPLMDHLAFSGTAQSRCLDCSSAL